MLTIEDARDEAKRKDDERNSREAVDADRVMREVGASSNTAGGASIRMARAQRVRVQARKGEQERQERKLRRRVSGLLFNRCRYRVLESLDNVSG